MFKNTKAFASFSVDNLAKAKEFYTQVLGLEVIDNPMGLIELKIESSSNVMIYPKTDHTPATFTILNFPVANIDDSVDSLLEKGVSFEHYEGEIQTDSKGICRSPVGPNIAWFKDPAGNILSVLQEK